MGMRCCQREPISLLLGGDSVRAPRKQGSFPTVPLSVPPGRSPALIRKDTAPLPPLRTRV